MECTNCIFSWYCFPSSHSEDDGEYDGDRIANGRMFSTPTLSPLLNTSFSFFSTFLLLPLFSVYARVFMLPSFLLFSINCLLHSLHSFFYKHYRFKKTHDFLEETKTPYYNYLVHFHTLASCPFCLFFGLFTIF
jgi:hypothetical protein